MRFKWMWLLVGWLMIVGVVGCGQMMSSLPAETTPTPRSDTPVDGAVVATAAVEPTSTLEAEPSPPGTGPSEEAAPSAIGMPAPLGTAVFISPTQVIQEETVAVNPTIPSPSDSALQGLVMQAKEDLAGRLSVGVDQIGLVEAKAVEWPDASLGCPEPGRVYAQVITPGYRIVLEASGERYEYHSDTQQRVVCCEPQQARPFPGGGSTETIELAKEDLAQKLGIPVDSIAVVVVLRQEFSTDAFYCRTTKERISRDEPPAVVSGESILLSATGRRYEYHASDQTVIFCRQLP